MSLTYPTRYQPGEEPATQVACVEVGASSCETALLDDTGALKHLRGVAAPPDVPLLLAVPGLIDGNRVLAASNLGWYDVDPAEALGLPGPVRLLCNDAEAAALGEYALRGAGPDLVFIGLGTGVGGAVVRGGVVTGNMLGHLTGFSTRSCRCGREGCLETVAAGWALPDSLEPETVRDLVEALATAIRSEPAADAELVVLAGGVSAAHPELVELLGAALPDRIVEATAAPAAAKSAAAWGLLHAFRQRP